MNWDSPWGISDNYDAERLMSDEWVINRDELPRFRK